MSDATLVSATLAGVFASLVENAVTYPLEYLKVREETAIRPLRHAFAARLEIPKLTSVFYSGLSPFAIGNALKTAARFNVFNAATKSMSEGAGGQVSAPVVVVSGTMAGVAETLIIVPFENIKTTMIEASALGAGAAKNALAPPGALGSILAHGRGAHHAGYSPKPDADALKHDPKSSGSKAGGSTVEGARGLHKGRPVRPVVRPSAAGHGHGLHEVVPVQGLVQTMRHMYAGRGLRAFVQGFNPTIWRQVMSSGIRFTAYSFWTQLFSLEGEEGLSLYKVVTGAALAAGAEVAVTQPLDVVKSRMQTTNGIRLYGNSLLCAYRVFTEEGWQRLWAGSLPRWMRMWVSGGIVWAAYEVSYSRINRQMQERPFQ